MGKIYINGSEKSNTIKAKVVLYKNDIEDLLFSH
ncbi:hypothetical protein BN1195_01498 [Chryseobacterium oranimense G311]|nr:hypothetical protein BN1195_01498 [Chryseobacterium oranimense G311]